MQHSASAQRTVPLKSCGDGGVATGAGGGYRWKHLVTNLHVGGLDVMAA